MDQEDASLRSFVRLLLGSNRITCPWPKHLACARSGPPWFPTCSKARAGSTNACSFPCACLCCGYSSCWCLKQSSHGVPTWNWLYWKGMILCKEHKKNAKNARGAAAGRCTEQCIVRRILRTKGKGSSQQARTTARKRIFSALLTLGQF